MNAVARELLARLPEPVDANIVTPADEAELATQRGERDACNRWRTITRMTRPETEVYKRALARARQACAP